MTTKPTVIVTGCSTGIGAHCARRLLEDGWHVVASARKEEDLARLKSEGCDAFFLEHRDAASIDAFFDQALEACGGRLDALFNNAGYAQPGPVEDLPMEALREQMEVNFFAYHQMMRRAAPIMRAQRQGRIVNCSSVLGRVCMPWRGAYQASKFALNALTVTMRMEMQDAGVHVSLIEPGPIPSNIALTGAKYADQYIDIEASPHREQLGKRLAELKEQDAPTDLSGAEPVYTALRHALTSRRPQAHYPVTWEAHMGIALDRFLPKSIVYRLLKRSA